MKKLVRISRIITTTLAIFLSSSNFYSQDKGCNSHNIKYDGPRNTEQLKKLLNESTNPLLQNLDAATKNSIITNMDFSEGLPAGMKNTDANLEKLYAPGANGAQVFGAILGADAIIVTFDTKPTVADMSVADFNKATKGGTTGYKALWSFCKNCCYPPRGSSCCDPSAAQDVLIILQ